MGTPKKKYPRRKADPPAKEGEQKCLHSYVDQHGIQRRCKKRLGHWGKHV